MLLPTLFLHSAQSPAIPGEMVLLVLFCLFPPMTVWIAVLNGMIASVLAATIVLVLLAGFRHVREQSPQNTARRYPMMNRELRNLIAVAEARARERLQQRQLRSVAEVLTECHMAPGLVAKATVVLERLADVLGVKPGLLQSQDTVGDLFRVYKSEIPPAAATGWAKIGFGDYVEPFSYELMWALERLSDRKRWTKLHASLKPPPKNEEAWIDAILSMSVETLLDAFGPLVKDKIA